MDGFTRQGAIRYARFKELNEEYQASKDSRIVDIRDDLIDLMSLIICDMGKIVGNLAGKLGYKDE